MLASLQTKLLSTTVKPGPETHPVKPDEQHGPILDSLPDALQEEPIAVPDPVENLAANLQNQTVPQRGCEEDFPEGWKRSGREVQLNDHLHKMKKVTSQKCACNEDLETLKHHLFNCKLY